LVESIPDSLPDSIRDWFLDCHPDSFLEWLPDSIVESLLDSHLDSALDWFLDCFLDSFVEWFLKTFVKTLVRSLAQCSGPPAPHRPRPQPAWLVSADAYSVPAMGASPPKPVVDLVERFERNRKVFLFLGCKEEQLRRESGPCPTIRHSDFVNRTFLGKPVIHEESIKACPERNRWVAGATKAPDYTFRIGGRRVFFAEARKPSVNIATDASPALQLRRYAGSARLPLSTLTDFEEFAVYDHRQKPVEIDRTSVASGVEVHSQS